jgi:hypothetical protein
VNSTRLCRNNAKTNQFVCPKPDASVNEIFREKLPTIVEANENNLSSGPIEPLLVLETN